MPLVQCPECQKEVSSEALSCPQCAFPYPGKKDRVNGNASGTLLACQDCGNPISKHAHACPHCGAPLAANRDKVENPVSPAAEMETEFPEAEEQTWLCPNCGVPYTRRIKSTKAGIEELGSVFPKTPSILPPRLNDPDEELKIPDVRPTVDMMVPRKERKRSPLWEEAKSLYEEEHQFPRPQKKWGLKFFLVFAVLVLFLIGIAFWRLDGLNPLEALVYWQM